MEFAAKDIHQVVYKDSSSGYHFKKTDVVAPSADGEGPANALLTCSVPVETGTVIVFSNYQMIHRVLKVVNTSPDPACREFAALFIVNPAAKSRLCPAARYLSSEEAQGVTDEQRQLARVTKLTSQLAPKGVFGSDDDVCSTGNGCIQMMRFVREQLELQCLDTPCQGGAPRYAGLTFYPTQVNRGVSEQLSASSADLEVRCMMFDGNPG
eukprot:TRINITY_DN52329_c0_g1_i1.p1 TRINITY_DN52329_c0_g1~~TRINITY_DN52329_c0_g1_i1.p1  ORF type:complete len:224 (+),score=61.64 TRINITY_DN52329_c0_g1_i1:44-673(+)